MPSSGGIFGSLRRLSKEKPQAMEALEKFGVLWTEFSDAVIAVYRLQKANEGAARQNIKAFIDRLSNLNLSM